MILLFLFFFTGTAHALEVKPFVSGSAATILSQHQGKPLILSFWSLTCPSCLAELPQFARLTKKYPKFDWVLVSTDTPQALDEIRSTLQKLRLTRAEHWVFADDFTDRLRYEIDRKWHGELPRTYLIDAQQQMTAYSGKMDIRQLDQWIRKQTTTR